MSKINETHSRSSFGLALRRTFTTEDSFKLMLSINKAFYSGVGVINDDLRDYNMGIDLPSLGGYLEAPLLIIAAQQGNNAALSDILEMGADIKVRDYVGRTALLEAAVHEHWEILKILVAANAEIDLRNTDGEKALHIASKKNGLGAIISLISAGASINERDKHMRTALHVAVSIGHPDVRECLLQADADINLRNNDSETPLHLSTSERRLDEMRILLAACPDLEWKNYMGETAFQKAAKRKNTGAIDLLKAAGAKESVASRMTLLQSYKAAKEQVSPKMLVAERPHISWIDTYELLDEDEPLLSFPR
ncbi:hypothetical protein N7493_009759 [Penicillium malachiteum]|uniref:Uncharacterized protein n=1 Tax=Penicillium malachiteum TaxID=1324776 RepID=A0AAD6MSK0_9EURO|nr:hypothetical protein N7493_009759 [Penicillium malachiteum]